MNPPQLKLLSRHYPWRWVPTGIAMLLLVVHDAGLAVEVAKSKLSSDQRAMLEHELSSIERVWEDGEVVALEHDSDFVESIIQIVDWAPAAARQCPYQSVSHDLMKLGDWSLKELDEYVMRSFMS